MSISSSAIASATEQSGGAFLVHELHTDHVGVLYPIVYYAAAGEDRNAALAAHAASLAARLIEADCILAVFKRPWNFVLTHASNNDLASFVRAAYQNSSKQVTAAIAARILEWIANGRFTDTQIRNVFNLTAGQWTTLKAKMQTLVDDLTVINSAAGE